MSNSTDSGFIQRSLNGWGTLMRALDALQPLAAFLARLYVAQVFFSVGPHQAARLGHHRRAFHG